MIALQSLDDTVNLVTNPLFLTSTVAATYCLKGYLYRTMFPQLRKSVTEGLREQRLLQREANYLFSRINDTRTFTFLPTPLDFIYLAYKKLCDHKNNR
jgi:hypothetical protein